MKTIKWVLPFSNIDYLQSLTEDLADNPAVRLITGIQDSEGNITDCNHTTLEISPDLRFCKQYCQVSLLGAWRRSQSSVQIYTKTKTSQR